MDPATIGGTDMTTASLARLAAEIVEGVEAISAMAPPERVTLIAQKASEFAKKSLK
jgi:hypothetical protein